jgi:hypothetical protein
MFASTAVQSDVPRRPDKNEKRPGVSTHFRTVKKEVSEEHDGTRMKFEENMPRGHHELY